MSMPLRSFFFFFSSRRRHTRLQGDWSSDVCSSDLVANNTWIQQHLAPGRQTGPYRVTGEYSYRSRYCAADGLVLIGDAFAFLDPVFSSGVFLALRSGELAADAVDAALTGGNVGASQF